MKKSFLYIPLLTVALTFLFAACEHPDTSEELPYYYTSPIAYLDDLSGSFTVTHSATLGILNTEEVSMPFNLRLTKALSSACTVTLTATLTKDDGTVIDGILSFSGGSMVTLAAGEKLVSGEVSISDWSFCTSVNDGAEYTVVIEIAEVEGESLYASTNYNSSIYTIMKTKCANSEASVPPTGTLLSDRSALSASYRTSSTASYSTDTSNKLFDNKSSSYLKTSTGMIDIIVDFGSPLELTGVYIYNYNSSYVPDLYTVEVSDDGENWSTVDEDVTMEAERYQNIWFYENQNARYLHIVLTNTVSKKYIYVCELNFYVLSDVG